MSKVIVALVVLAFLAVGGSAGYFFDAKTLLQCSVVLIVFLCLIGVAFSSDSNEGSWVGLIWVIIGFGLLAPAWLSHFILHHASH